MPSSSATPSDSTTGTTPDALFLASLPTDIVLETIVATLVTIAGLVLSTGSLRPIRWREWAGKIEREGEDGFRKDGGTGEVERDFVGNPFRFLETRPGFVDIRKQRREFTEWVVSSGGGK